MTLDYLTKQFKSLGFKPGNGESFLQAVPLVSIEADSDMSLKIGNKQYQYGDDMVINSSQLVSEIGIKDSPLVICRLRD